MSKEYKQYSDKEIMNEKEQWANNVLESFSGIERATPNHDLFDKILMDLPEHSTQLVLTKHLKWVAMIATVVMGLNVYVLTLERQTTSIDLQDVESEYSLQFNFNFYAE